MWLHVDACVGGYIAPFVRMNGATCPSFDFTAPGVWSISGDLHKYGYASKGASTVFFRSAELREHMTFDAGPWPLGRMVTPTLAGTRPGGAIAAAWAVMNFLGVDGLSRQAARGDRGARQDRGRRQEARLPRPRPTAARHRQLHARARPMRLRSTPSMHQRGWFTAALLEPKALHLMLSPKHLDVTDEYLADLGRLARRGPRRRAEQQLTPKYAG